MASQISKGMLTLLTLMDDEQLVEWSWMAATARNAALLGLSELLCNRELLSVKVTLIAGLIPV